MNVISAELQGMALSLTDIQKTDVAVPARALLKCLKILGQDVLVVVCLHGTHFHAQDAFAFCWKRFKHIALQPSKHQRLKLGMQLFDFRFVVRIVKVELAG